MKFSILALAAAVPTLAAVVPASANTTEVDVAASVNAFVDTAEVKRANCKLELKWIKNWHKAALRRYRVQLVTTPRNDDHIHKYCDLFKQEASGIHNVQCFWTDGIYVIDDSESEGSIGHNDYLKRFNRAAYLFELTSGCDTVRNL